MSVLELTKENFTPNIRDNKIVIIDFWAEWCNPCKIFTPIFEKMSENHNDVIFATVNVENQFELSDHFEIRAIPTMIATRNQEIVYNQAGVINAEQLEIVVDMVKSI